VVDSPRPADPPSPGGDAVPDLGALAVGIRRGDARAFDRFYAAYFDRLYRFLLVLCRGKEDLTRDALQETLVRVLKHVRPFPDEPAFWRWLTRVARTALVDLLRKAKTRAEVSLEPLLDGLSPPDEDRTDHVLLEALGRALGRLAPDERALIEAHYLAGTPQRALALDQETTRKAIETRIARIRRKLKALLLADLSQGEAPRA
jgi:RNA polymerase sigma-70 factor (ECF subfamily)